MDIDFSNVGGNRYKIIIISVITLATLFVAIYVNLVLGVSLVYTHLFYIPIILAGIWFHKKAIYVALFLGTSHVLMSYWVSSSLIFDALFRAVIFLVIAYIVGAIAEKKDHLYDELKASENKLRQMRDNLELTIQERTAKLNEINESLKSEILERNKIEKALRKSSAILSRAQTIAHVGNWAWELGTGKLQWSDEVYKIFDLSSPDLQPTVGWLISKVYPDDRELVKRSFDDALYNNKLFNIDYRILLPDGSIRYVNNVADKFKKGPGGNPLWLYGIIQDISQRKKAEDERLQLADRVLLLLNSTGEGIYGMDLDARCTFINRSAAKILGYAPEEILGKNTHRLFHYSYKDGSPYPYEKCSGIKTLKTGQHYRIDDEVFWRKDGTSFSVEYSSYPIVSEGIIKGAVIVFNDNTEKKRAEKALIASKAQADFYVDIMAHDINNMDQAVMGYLELAQDMLNISEEQKKLLAEPIQIIKRTTKLIDNVKKLQRLKAGEVASEKIDVGKVLSEVKAEYSNSPERNVDIHYSPVTGYMVMANSLLKDVFSNIVENSIKHSKGPLTISIEVLKVEKNGRQYYRVDIEDNGPGITDELKKKLFIEVDKYKIKAERRGFGLQLVSALVQMFKGRVWVEDRIPGDHTKGARFVVILPAVKCNIYSHS